MPPAWALGRRGAGRVRAALRPSCARLAQHLVAGGPAMAVVDGLEAVDVGDGDIVRAPRPRVARPTDTRMRQAWLWMRVGASRVFPRPAARCTRPAERHRRRQGAAAARRDRHRAARARGVIRQAGGAKKSCRRFRRQPSEKVARPERFELPTAWFVARYSIQLSYGRAARMEIMRDPVSVRQRSAPRSVKKIRGPVPGPGGPAASSSRSGPRARQVYVHPGG